MLCTFSFHLLSFCSYRSYLFTTVSCRCVAQAHVLNDQVPPFPRPSLSLSIYICIVPMCIYDVNWRHPELLCCAQALEDEQGEEGLSLLDQMPHLVKGMAASLRTLVSTPPFPFLTLYRLSFAPGRTVRPSYRRK